MRDFFGQELRIGDRVGVLLKGYRHLVNAKVIQFTPKMIRVEYPSMVPGYIDTYLVDSKMLVKRPD